LLDRKTHSEGEQKRTGHNLALQTDRYKRRLMLALISIKDIHMSTSHNRSTDEAEIRDLVESWAKAVRTKDLEGIFANHFPEILMFDVPPPDQSKGIEAYKKTWNVFFAWFQDSGGL